MEAGPRTECPVGFPALYPGSLAPAMRLSGRQRVLQMERLPPVPHTAKVVKVTCDAGCWPPSFVKKPPQLLIVPAHKAALTCCGRRHGHLLGSVLPREGPGQQCLGSLWGSDEWENRPAGHGGLRSSHTQHPSLGSSVTLSSRASASWESGWGQSSAFAGSAGRAAPGWAGEAPRVVCATENGCVCEIKTRRISRRPESGERPSAGH